MKLTQWLTLVVGVGVTGAGLIACGNDEGTLESSQVKNGSKDDDGDSVDAGSTKRDAGSTKRDAGTGSSSSKPGGSGGSGGSVDNTCDALTVAAHPNSPEILIVLDRSGSMIGLGGAQNAGRNRWQGSMNAVQKVTAQLTETVAFGLMTFPARSALGIGGIGAAASTCAAGKVDVPVATNSASMIADVLRMSTPDFGATPTAATLEAARTALESGGVCADCVDAAKFVLLVTDGQPTCGTTGGGDSTPADVAATNDAIDKLRTNGILTYVVGYDTQNDATVAATMNGFAQHGGTERHYPVENETMLVNELTRIASALVPCEYELAHEVDDPNYVRVTIDGEQQNLSDGAWRIDGKKIILEGACNKLKDAKVHDLHIVRECDIVNVI